MNNKADTKITAIREHALEVLKVLCEDYDHKQVDLLTALLMGLTGINKDLLEHIMATGLIVDSLCNLGVGFIFRDRQISDGLPLEEYMTSVEINELTLTEIYEFGRKDNHNE